MTVVRRMLVHEGERVTVLVQLNARLPTPDNFAEYARWPRRRRSCRNRCDHGHHLLVAQDARVGTFNTKPPAAAHPCAHPLSVARSCCCGASTASSRNRERLL